MYTDCDAKGGTFLLNTRMQKMIYSALYLAVALVLPFVTGQIPEIGSMLSPMHIPVLLCGFVCGWQWGLGVGLIAPLLRSMLFGMPPLYPTAIAMTFELPVYGAVAGILYRLLPKKTWAIYVSLITAMICGRVVWGAARYVLAGLSGTEFPMSAFLAGAVFNAVPGIVLHIILIPVLVRVLQKAGLMLNEEK
ncbi:MAG: ECF transporter S component [Firmicutes bacterium]|nr:ECF transporter S component [Bacillota bacterium]